MKSKLLKAAMVAMLLSGVVLTASSEALPAPRPNMSLGSKAISYPLCFAYDSAPCEEVGSHFTCYIQYPSEPGICICTSSLMLACG